MTTEAKQRVPPAGYADAALGERPADARSGAQGPRYWRSGCGDDFYAIAVYGIPRGAITDDSKERQDELKKLAVLKREGKKDLKPTRVDILLRESGPLVVYLFSKSAEFNWRDHGITFEAQISRLKFSQAFNTDDMTFHGKLEL